MFLIRFRKLFPRDFFQTWHLLHYALILKHQGQTYTFRARPCLTLLAKASTRRKLPDMCAKKRNLNR